MNYLKNIFTIFFKHKTKYLLISIIIQHLAIAFLTAAQENSPSSVVKALVVYAQDSNDHYPFPSKGIRDSIYTRLSGLYNTLSYGSYEILFKEATNNGSYFVSNHPASYYKEHYERKKHVCGFAMFNEEILNQVKAQKGDQYFSDVNMIIVAGTDGGRGWYTSGVNATGYGMLGINFSAGGKMFGMRQGQGGITVEIGSDIGTADPNDDRLSTLQEIYWNFAHEYGHWLKLGHRSCTLGIYSLMCKKLNSNSKMPDLGPQPLDIFHIMHLGWIDESDSSRVKIITREMGNSTLTLNQIRSPIGLVLARIDIPETSEKLFVSYHRQNSNTFDGVYMGEGLLIWHKRGSRIDLKCANASGPDAGDHLDEGKNLGGLATDFFNSNNIFQFTPRLKHANSVLGVSNDQRHPPTTITIKNIQQNGGQVTFKVILR